MSPEINNLGPNRVRKRNNYITPEYESIHGFIQDLTQEHSLQLKEKTLIIDFDRRKNNKKNNDIWIFI